MLVETLFSLLHLFICKRWKLVRHSIDEGTSSIAVLSKYSLVIFPESCGNFVRLTQEVKSIVTWEKKIKVTRKGPKTFAATTYWGGQNSGLMREHKLNLYNSKDLFFQDLAFRWTRHLMRYWEWQRSIGFNLKAFCNKRYTKTIWIKKATLNSTINYRYI